MVPAEVQSIGGDAADVELLEDPGAECGPPWVSGHVAADDQVVGFQYVERRAFAGLGAHPVEPLGDVAARRDGTRDAMLEQQQPGVLRAGHGVVRELDQRLHLHAH